MLGHRDLLRPAEYSISCLISRCSWNSENRLIQRKLRIQVSWHSYLQVWVQSRKSLLILSLQTLQTASLLCSSTTYNSECAPSATHGTTIHVVSFYSVSSSASKYQESLPGPAHTVQELQPDSKNTLGQVGSQRVRFVAVLNPLFTMTNGGTLCAVISFSYSKSPTWGVNPVRHHFYTLATLYGHTLCF